MTYKIYTKFLKRRLKKKIERKELFISGESGFQKGGFRRGTELIDNFFILNHIVQREKQEKGVGIYRLESGFDNIDRKKLWVVLDEKEIDKQLIGRMKRTRKRKL